jgi:EpsI family protein
MNIARTNYISKAVPVGYWLVLVLSIVSLAIATWLTPHETWFNHIGKPDYEIIVPKQFGDWVDTGETSGGMVVSPEQAAAVESVYSQVVSRAYQYKPTGEMLMLSIGYGDIQLRTKQLHRPESCYSSQGFLIEHLHPEQLKVGDASIGLFRMSGTMGNRTEQVTYWIRVGNKIISGSPKELNLKRMALGLEGYVADGLLFRVSTIDTDSEKAKHLQDIFINDLLKSVGVNEQLALVAQPVVL